MIISTVTSPARVIAFSMPEHLVGLGGREHRRRLVEDHEAAPQVELLEDLDLLLLARGEAARPAASRSSAERHRLHEGGEPLALVAASARRAGTSSRAITRFSATVMLGTSVKCW